MSTRALFVAVLFLTAVIFVANHYAAQKPQDWPECYGCECKVTVTSVVGKSNVKLPSCSVVFRPYVPKSELSINKTKVPLWRGPHTFQLSGKGSDYILSPRYELYSCVWTVFCDPTYTARVECKDVNQQVSNITPEQKCSFGCTMTDLEDDCEHWVRPNPTPTPPPTSPPKKKSRPGLLDTTLSMFLTRNETYDSFIAHLVPAKYSPQPIDNNEGRSIISRSIQWRPNGADAGLENDLLLVASGEPEAQSFCTGDSIRLAAPGAVTLPSCEFDVSGNWWGAYGRRTEDYESEPVTVNINLRNEAGSLRGELTTSDGPFDVVSISKSNSGFELQATRAVAGGQQKIVLKGKITKGEIVFGGSEQSAGNKNYKLTGILKRLYVAQNALPPAVLNQPYNFKVVALSPTGSPVTFRLATPAPKQPEQISWSLEAQSLRGRNGQRFTYFCPPNGSLGRLYSRDNAYTDTSSICTAAVSAHVITQQSGGVVTLEIRPGPGPDTGRFVFVAAEPESGVRGRLPQGISFDSQTGTFNGTPSELGSFEIGVVADDGVSETFRQRLTLTVRKMVVTNAWLADAFVGQPYKATLQVRGGVPPYRFSGSVPRGLQLDPNTGELSGTPTSTGSGFEVTVRDSQNNSETQKLSLVVRGTTILTSYFLPEATQGVPYHAQLRAVGNSSSITWSVGKGDLGVVGLTLNSQTGELSGTSNATGVLTFSVRAQASDGHTRSFALVVNR